LYTYLRAHPDVWMPPLKELTYWDLERTLGRSAPKRRNRLRFAAAHTWRDRRELGGLARDLRFLGRYALLRPSDRWYRSLFAPAGDRPCGDLSPTYIRLDDREVAELRQALPRAKVFFMLRDPFDRGWSNARKVLARGRQRRMEDVPDHEIEEYFTSDSFRTNYDYVSALRRWRAVIDADDLFIGFTADLDDRPGAFFDEFGPFIGVDPEPLKEAERSTAREFTTGSYGGAIPARWERLLAEQLQPMLDELADDLGGETERWRSRAEAARQVTPGAGTGGSPDRRR
jgi:hypothetical protein